MKGPWDEAGRRRSLLHRAAGEGDHAKHGGGGASGVRRRLGPWGGGAWFESERVKVHCGVETPFSPARKAHIAFRVDDVAGLAKRAKAAGYEVIDDDLLPGHERIYIYDPFGNRLEFLRPVEG